MADNKFEKALIDRLSGCDMEADSLRRYVNTHCGFAEKQDRNPRCVPKWRAQPH